MLDFAGRDARSRPSRSVAQPGSALVWGTRGRRFESCRSDHFKKVNRRSVRYILFAWRGGMMTANKDGSSPALRLKI